MGLRSLCVSRACGHRQKTKNSWPCTTDDHAAGFGVTVGLRRPGLFPSVTIIYSDAQIVLYLATKSLFTELF